VAAATNCIHDVQVPTQAVTSAHAGTDVQVPSELKDVNGNDATSGIQQKADKGDPKADL
jgi:hypothetical protein